MSIDFQNNKEYERKQNDIAEYKSKEEYDEYCEIIAELKDAWNKKNSAVKFKDNASYLPADCIANIDYILENFFEDEVRIEE